MRRGLRYLILAIALLFSQHATQLHALAHDSGHISAKCLSFHVADHAVPGAGIALPPAGSIFHEVSVTPEIIPSPTRVVFDSRAPPALP